MTDSEAVEKFLVSFAFCLKTANQKDILSVMEAQGRKKTTTNFICIKENKCSKFHSGPVAHGSFLIFLLSQFKNLSIEGTLVGMLNLAGMWPAQRLLLSCSTSIYKA